MPKLKNLCVCGHLKKDHELSCIEILECAKCPDCMFYHTERSDPKLVREFADAFNRKYGPDSK